MYKENNNVRTVIVVANLLLILVFGVDDDVWDELEEDVPKQLGGEDHRGPVMAEFHYIEDVA
jgi:hypothetical protein